MLLGAGIGRVHVAGEQEVEPIAASAPVPDRVRPPGVDERQIGVHADAAHARGEILRDADLVPGRTADVHEVRQQRANIVAGEVGEGLLKTRMEHTESRRRNALRLLHAGSGV